jgi:hypothetical protein
MQDGPDNLPKTKAIGKMPCPALPWPWRALQAAFSDLWPLAAFKEFNWFALPALLMDPAFALFACFHWLSLLLCWEPVFPAAIRKACGEPFRRRPRSKSHRPERLGNARRRAVSGLAAAAGHLRLSLMARPVYIVDKAGYAPAAACRKPAAKTPFQTVPRK